MTPLFLDRRDAGRQVGALVRSRGYDHMIVLSIHNGATLVAMEVAQVARAPLTVFSLQELRAERPSAERLSPGNELRSAGTVILVDDGSAPLATLTIAAIALRKLGLRKLLLALPVLDRELRPALSTLVDDVIAVAAPDVFSRAGDWYFDFAVPNEAAMVLCGAECVSVDAPDVVPPPILTSVAQASVNSPVAA